MATAKANNTTLLNIEVEHWVIMMIIAYFSYWSEADFEHCQEGTLVSLEMESSNKESLIDKVLGNVCKEDMTANAWNNFQAAAKKTKVDRSLWKNLLAEEKELFAPPKSEKDFSDIIGMTNEDDELIDIKQKPRKELTQKFCHKKTPGKVSMDLVEKILAEKENDNDVKRAFALLSLQYIVCPPRYGKLESFTLNYVDDLSRMKMKSWAILAMESVEDNVEETRPRKKSTKIDTVRRSKRQLVYTFTFWWCKEIFLFCQEKKVLYKLISGLHSSISVHIAADYILDETTNQHPEHVQNLYFTFLFVLRAVTKAALYLDQAEYDSGNPTYKLHVLFLLMRLNYGKGQSGPELKQQIQKQFRNISFSCKETR
ncbi:hypothetical protein LXL04_038299 [Taraxacum kok-saghyz]